MKKQVDVVMLPTEKANVGMIAKCIKDDFTNSFDRIGKLCLITNNEFYKPNIYWQPQHLYFLSDDEIKEGDYWFNLDDNTINNDISLYKLANNAPSCKKIIATTDESLTTEKQYKSGWGAKINLPRPSNEFLKKFCELGGVDKVLVEYEKVSRLMSADIVEKENWTLLKDHKFTFERLKVAPDNTITIYPIELC
jgi:hypothetical protein